MLLFATVISIGAWAQFESAITNIKSLYIYPHTTTFNIKVKLTDGDDLVYGSDYIVSAITGEGVSISDGGVITFESKSIGEHTLVITGDGYYSGASLTIPFEIACFRSDDGTTIATGTEGDPFVIKNSDDLDLLSEAVSSGNEFKENNNKHFKLGSNITYDSNTEHNYTPIGGFSNNVIREFLGNFDGDGHTIKGIRVSISGEEGFVGLFGRLGKGAVVKNLTLDDANITGPQKTGGIAGINKGGIIYNCHVTSSVIINANNETWNSWHGGIVGSNESDDGVSGKVSNCTSAAKLTVGNIDTWNFYGGIAGQNMSGCTLDHNLVIGAIIPYADGKHYGAIVGQNESSGSLDHNYYADCTKKDNKDIGGCNGADVTTNDGAEIAIALYDSGTNATHNSMTITKYGNDGKTHNVILAGRTLYKDGAWNTLYLPFAFRASQIEYSTLSGATIKELDITRWYDSEGNYYEEAGDGRHRTGYDASDGTLYLNFMTSSEISSVTPYIIKWESGDNLVNPVFPDVTISTTSPSPSPILPSTDGFVSFDGTYDSTTYMSSDNTKLLIGGKNPVTGKTMLYYPKPDLSDPDNPKYPSIGAFRAYFQLNKGLTFGDPNATVRAFSLNFDDDPTGIITTDYITDKAGAWYSLDGRKYNAKPTAKGLYIHHGKKIVIK